MILVSNILLWFLSQSITQEVQLKNHYYIKFSKIDNQAKVYLEDSLIITTNLYEGNPDLNIQFDLNTYLKKGNNNIRVELINGSGDGIIGYDTYWHIYYEIFENKIPIDYMSDKSNNGTTGLVFSMTHEIMVE